MGKICANCSSTQGPYLALQVLFDTVYVCKSTKLNATRLTECVEKRAKRDADKYKELLHPYS